MCGEKTADQWPQETAEEEADRDETEDWTAHGFQLFCQSIRTGSNNFDRLKNEIKALKGPIAEARRVRIERLRE